MMSSTPSMDGSGTAQMVCPDCGSADPFPPTVSDDATTTCPKCGCRFPVNDVTPQAARS